MTFARRRNGRTLLLSNRYRGSRTAISPSFVCQRSFFYLGDASEVVDEFLVPSLRPAAPPTPAYAPRPHPPPPPPPTFRTPRISLPPPPSPSLRFPSEFSTALTIDANRSRRSG